MENFDDMCYVDADAKQYHLASFSTRNSTVKTFKVENLFKICEGWHIEWMRRVYNIGPKKLFLVNLFCLLALHYFPFTKFIALKSSLNLQKCLKYLNLEKIIKWKLKWRTAKRIVIDHEYAFTCEGFFFTYHVHRTLRNM